MSEYWQEVSQRGQATIVVWERHFPSMMLGSVGAGVFGARLAALPALAQTVSNVGLAASEARTARDAAARPLLKAGIQVPGVIEGSVDASALLAEDLEKVTGIRPYSFARIVSRGRALSPVWAAANQWRAAQVPPLPPVEAAGFTQAGFQAALEAFGELEQGVANAEKAEATARMALRVAARGVEELCIRFLKAAKGTAEADSAEEDALGTIPRQTVSGLPATLRIRGVEQGGGAGLQVLVGYGRFLLKEGESASLEYRRLDLDPAWLAVSCEASGNVLGPFEPGQTVEVRTRVKNGAGARTGKARSITLAAPAA
jgi:hypothetical protein